MIVLVTGVVYFAGDHQVASLGERRVFSARTRHVDDAFLETNDLTGGHNSHTLENVGTAFANHGLFTRVTAREHTAIAFYLATWLDHVLHWHDTSAVAW